MTTSFGAGAPGAAGSSFISVTVRTRTVGDDAAAIAPCPRRLPRRVLLLALLRGGALREHPLVTETGLVFLVELEDVRIPEHDAMAAAGRMMEPRPHGPVGAALDVVGALEDRVLAERRAAGRLLRRAAVLRTRIEDGRERVEPAVGLLVTIIADDGQHEQLPRARRRDIEEPMRLFAVLLQDLLASIEQLLRRGAAERHRPELALWVDVTRRIAEGRVGGRVDEDDDGELEALRLVHRHDADAVGAFLDDGRLVRAAALGVILEARDEGAERRDRALLEAARHVEHAEDVAERLLTGGPDRDARVRPRLLEQARDHARDRAAVAAHVELREHVEGLRRPAS